MSGEMTGGALQSSIDYGQNLRNNAGGNGTSMSSTGEPALNQPNNLNTPLATLLGGPIIKEGNIEGALAKVAENAFHGFVSGKSGSILLGGDFNALSGCDLKNLAIGEKISPVAGIMPQAKEGHGR